MKAAINGITMAYDDAGSGPALLLIHGFPLNRRMWRPQLNAVVAAGYRVIAPDLRGFGESEAAGEPSMSLYADDLAALLEYLKIEWAVVGGMSMGGYVLFDLLERYPQRLKAACFIVTRSGADDEAGKARRLALAQEVKKSGPDAVAAAFAKILFAQETVEKKPQLLEEVYTWMVNTDRRGLVGGLIAMRERKDFTPLLGNFRLPALVIGGERDQAIPRENSEALANSLPNCRSCIVPGAGHMANLEKPEVFNACLLDFLKGLYPSP